MPFLYNNIKTASALTDSVIVMFSTGKESVVTLDLCARYFKNVHACFMYLVKGLEFQERVIRYYENKYGIEVLRIPHYRVAHYLRYGYYCRPDLSVRETKLVDCYNRARQHFGIEWIAAGETICDSRVRRAMIKSSSSIDVNRKRFFPVAEWKRQDIRRYIQLNKLRIAEEYQWLKSSFALMDGESLKVVRDHYPDDFRRIKEVFPLAEAAIIQFEIEHERNLRNKKDKPVGNLAGGLQSEDDLR
jgi:phosphoadenosine phosphosulfate reductase